jgi:hypothetical protein
MKRSVAAAASAARSFATLKQAPVKTVRARRAHSRAVGGFAGVRGPGRWGQLRRHVTFVVAVTATPQAYCRRAAGARSPTDCRSTPLDADGALPGVPPARRSLPADATRVATPAWSHLHSTSLSRPAQAASQSTKYFKIYRWSPDVEGQKPYVATYAVDLNE